MKVRDAALASIAATLASIDASVASIYIYDSEPIYLVDQNIYLMATITKEQAIDIAKYYYLKGDVSQQEISKKVGYSVVTISKWMYLQLFFQFIFDSIVYSSYLFFLHS